MLPSFRWSGCAVRGLSAIVLLVGLVACRSFGQNPAPVAQISPSPAALASADVSPSPDDADPSLQVQLPPLDTPRPPGEGDLDMQTEQNAAQPPNAPVVLSLVRPGRAPAAAIPPANPAQPRLPVSALAPGSKIPVLLSFYHASATSAVPAATAKPPIVTCTGTPRSGSFKGTCMMNLNAGCEGVVSALGFQGLCSTGKLGGLCLSPDGAPGLLVGGNCVPATGMGAAPAPLPSPTPALSLGPTGAWDDPIPFGSNAAEFAPGTVIWVPTLEKYFVMREDCAACDTAWSAQQYAVALSSGTVSDAVVYSAQNCEAALQNEMTGPDRTLTIVVAPPSDEPVNRQPIFNPLTNLCFDQTVYPNEPRATPAPPAAQAVPQQPVPVTDPQFVVFWQSWSDRSDSTPFARLSSIPSAVTMVDVAFSTADGNTILPPQNTDPIDASAIHAHGGKVLLAIGGSQSSFDITDPNAFAVNVATFLQSNAGTYDGVDFNDGQMPSHGARRLAAVIAALRAKFPPPFIITYDAFLSGADPQVRGDGHQGEDRALLQAIGSQIDWVNVMDYDQYDWRPSAHPNCAFVPSARDDCYRDVLADYATQIAPSKILMGLMIPRADDGAGLSPADVAAYAGWVKANGYGGVMLWNINRDTAQGDYAQAIAGAL